jgi:hypothetical protein
MPASKDDDLRLAPAGAADAACAVCLHMTFNRITIGDGHVPICSTFCLQAWPRVRDLLADRDEWRRQHENALASWQADISALAKRADNAADDRSELAEALEDLLLVMAPGMKTLLNHEKDKARALLSRMKAGCLAAAAGATETPGASTETENMSSCSGPNGELK